MLVTGGLGFMGSAFLRYLFMQDLVKGNVINLDQMTYAANPHNVAPIANDPRYIFVKGSILDGDLLEKLYAQFSFSQIVHFAAETHVDNSIANPATFIETNIYGTFTLLEFVRRHPNVHLHIISTDEVYGSLDSDGSFTENSPFNPNSPYSASKASADHLSRSYHKTYGLHITRSHSSNNYGPGQHNEKLIPRMITNLASKQSLPVYGDGGNIRDWLFVEDHARGVYDIITKARAGSVYNIGGHNEWTNLDLIYLLIRIFSEITGENESQLRGLIKFVKDRPGHDYRYAISNQKIREEIGWGPQYDMKLGLHKTLNWYLYEKKQDSMYHSCPVGI